MGWLLTKNRPLRLVSLGQHLTSEKATLITNQLLTEWNDTWRQSNGVNGTQAEILGALPGWVPWKQQQRPGHNPYTVMLIWSTEVNKLVMIEVLHPKWSWQNWVDIKKEWWPFRLKKVFLKQITSEQQLVNHASKGECMVIWCRDRRLIKGDILEESTCCLLNDSWRLKGERKTKNYLEKDSWERTKQSRVEKLESSQSGCTRKKLLARQH